MPQDFEKDHEHLPSDEDLFASPVEENLTEKDLFAGDNDFFDKIEKSQSPVPSREISDILDNTQTPPKAKKSDINAVITKKTTQNNSRKKLTLTLVAFIIFFAMLLGLALIMQPTGQQDSQKIQAYNHSDHNVTGSENVQSSAYANPSSHSALSDMTDIENPAFAMNQGPVSLEIAEKLFFAGKYDTAGFAYAKLLDNYPIHLGKKSIQQFLKYRQAGCLELTGKTEKAYQLYKPLLASNSASIKLAVNYNLARLNLTNNNFTKARTRAYCALGLIDLIELEQSTKKRLTENCNFIVSSSLAREALALGESIENIPENIWFETDPIQILDHITTDNIEQKLAAGTGKLQKAFLGPNLNLVRTNNNIEYYNLTANAAPINEVLAKIAASTKLDVVWSFQKGTPRSKRSVSLHLSDKAEDRLLDIAAGSAGLIADYDENGNIIIFDPAEFLSLNKQKDILTAKAVKSMQEYIFTYPQSDRACNINFALALLHTQQDQLTSAIARYKLISKKYSFSELAPYALLKSSELKVKIKDHFGAKEDLQTLVERYPDVEIATEATLFMAEASLQAGLNGEASHLFKKVYQLDLTSRIRKKAAYGAGRSFYKLNQFSDAVKWLNIYLELAQNDHDEKLYKSYSYLGKSLLNLGRTAQACIAFKNAVKGDLGRDDYLKTVRELVEGSIKSDDFLLALDALQGIDPAGFSIKEAVGLIVLESKVLRAMGLNEKAIAMLDEKKDYITDQQLRAELIYQKSLCLIDQRQFKNAVSLLDEIFSQIDKSDIYYRIGLKTAEMKLLTEDMKTAEQICRTFMEETDPLVRQKAVRLLSKIYRKQKLYEKAANVLLSAKTESDIDDNVMVSRAAQQ